MPLLDIQKLSLRYLSRRDHIRAVDNVSLSVEKGEALGLVGESGCGKTSLALAILRLLPSNAEITSGSIMLGEKDLLKISEEEMRRVRWREVSLIFQNSMNALNPVKTIGEQIAEPIMIHKAASREEAYRRATQFLELVGINKNRLGSYQHELSGGMKQRVLIAMALACEPKLVIADEPATALDVMVQAQILELLNTLRKKLSLSLVLITHDLAIVAETCDKVAVMHAGKIVEYGYVEEVFQRPTHPYTQNLLKSLLTLSRGIENLEADA